MGDPRQFCTMDRDVIDPRLPHEMCDPRRFSGMGCDVAMTSLTQKRHQAIPYTIHILCLILSYFVHILCIEHTTDIPLP